jgi:hypothetical protein
VDNCVRLVKGARIVPTERGRPLGARLARERLPSTLEVGCNEPAEEQQREDLEELDQLSTPNSAKIEHVALASVPRMFNRVRATLPGGQSSGYGNKPPKTMLPDSVAPNGPTSFAATSMWPQRRLSSSPS